MAAATKVISALCRCFLAHGADCDAEDDYNDTVLVKAAGSGNAQVVQALLDAGADPCQRGELSRRPHEEAEHLQRPPSPNPGGPLLANALEFEPRSF